MYSMNDRAAPRRRAGKINLKVAGCIGAALFGFLCLVCCGGGAGVYWYHTTEAAKAAKQAERQRILDALKPELSSYLDVNRQAAVPGKKKFKGKVVCIDATTKEIDEESVTELPESLRAANPGEVGAVAWLTWSQEEGGNYDDGSKAIVRVVDIQLFNKPTRGLLVHHRIVGDTQSSKLSWSKGDSVGPKPWDKVAALLQEYADAY
jgi:hypothetical protein